MGNGDDGGAAARVHSHWANIVDAAHDRIAGKLATAKHEHVAGILEHIESDLAPALAPFLTDAANNEQLPTEVRELCATLIAPEHFGQSLLLGIAVGAVLSPVLHTVLAPALQALSNVAWHGAATTPGNPGTIPLSPEQQAIATLRHNPHIANPRGEAAKSGISAEDFAALVYNTGDSPAIGELLQLYRRGLIDQGRLETGLHQSRVRDEWFPEILDLRFAPPPAGEVIAGSIKNHLTPEDARRKLGEAGVNPENFEWMRQTAGRPPGPQQMLHLWNRGEITEAEVDDAIRQSDINDRFLPAVKQLRWYLPPVRTTVALIRQGAISDGEARVLFAHNGVRPADAEAYIRGAHHTAAATGRHLSQAQIVRMYEARFMTRADATARLAELHFPDAEIAVLLDYADEMRHEKLIGAAVTRIGTAYRNHFLDKPAATTALSTLGLPVGAAGEYFAVWDEERVVLVHHLTPAQVIGAFRRGEIEPGECKRRLLDLGVRLGDIGILVADGWPPTKPEEARAAAAIVVNA